MVDNQTNGRKTITGKAKLLTGLVLGFTLTATGVALATPSSSPEAKVNLNPSSLVTAGENTSQVISTDGTRYSKGLNQYGQLGVAGDSLSDWTASTDGLKWKKIVSPLTNSIGLTTDGSAYTWGDNRAGQLGNGSTQPNNAPQKVTATYTFKTVSAGADFVVALDAGGNLFTWGANDSGQLGDGGTKAEATPELIAYGTKFNTVKAGKNFVLALDANNNLWSWGDNSFGQLGNGNKTAVNKPTKVSDQVWKMVNTNSTSTTSVGITSNGYLATWGNNDKGQLANGTDWRQEQVDENNRVAAQIQAIKDADAARRNTLIQQCQAVRQDAQDKVDAQNKKLKDAAEKKAAEKKAKKDAEDEAKASASPSPTANPTATPTATATPSPTATPDPEPTYTPVPDPTYDNTCAEEVDKTFKATDTSNIKPKTIPEPALTSAVVRPTVVSSVRSYVYAAVGTQNGFAIDTANRLFGWGSDAHGQTGLNISDAKTHTQLPVYVQSITTFSMVDAGNGFASAVAVNGDLYTWGAGSNGELATGNSDDKIAPTKVDSGYSTVSTGQHTAVAVKTDGNINAWGAGTNGLLGDGKTGDRNKIGSANAKGKAVSVGGASVASLNSGDSLISWGANKSTFGNGENSDTPVKPVETRITKFKDVSAGQYSSIAVDENGIVWAWGSNLQGQVGVNAGKNISHPVMVPLTSKVKLVSSGFVSNFVATDDNRVFAWGFDVKSKTPKEIENTADIKQFASGTDHIAVLDTDGNVWNWGPNSYGATGIKSDTKLTQVDTGNVKFKTVAAGGSSTVAISTNGTLYGWGSNLNGQLLDSKGYGVVNKPQVVDKTNKYLSVSVSSTHTLAVDKNNVVYGWGVEPDGTFSGSTAKQTEPYVLPIIVNSKEGK